MPNFKNWKELSRNLVFSKKSRQIEKVIFELPDGRKSDFYIKQEGSVVCVLALTKENKVILTKQYRPGLKEMLLELPGGAINKDEKPNEAIKREFLEETGYTGNFKFVTLCYDDAYSTRKRYCFVATSCRLIKEPRTDKDEFIETKLLSLDEFRKLLRSGKMTDVEVGYLGLDSLALL
jgi:ADP-ribose pyrophosphatase